MLGLISLESYNRIYNIQVDINDKFYYDDYMLTLPPGGYTIDDVHEAISVSMIKQFGVKPFADGTHKFELTANTITHRCRIFSTFNIDFETRVHSIGPLLGFKPRVLAAHQPHESDYPVKFIEDHHISVTCNIIRDVFTNQEQSHSLYDFIVTSPCGYIIRENPSVFLYCLLYTSPSPRD